MYKGAKSLQSCPTLCDPTDHSLPIYSVHEFSRQEYWSGLPCLPPGDLPDLRIHPASLMAPALVGAFFTTSTTWEAHRTYMSLVKRMRAMKLSLVFILLDFPGGSDGKASAYNVGDHGSIPGLGRSLGEGNGNPLQYSCLENPMDGEAW